MRAESLEFLRELVMVPSPSGYESKAAGVFRRFVQPFSERVESDVLGNVYAFLNPDAEFRVMLAGHIDEIGFIVNFISEDGLVHFRGIGDHDVMVPVGQWVWVHGRERIPGVIGRKAIHLLLEDGDRKDRVPKMHELWIDIGATTREDAERFVRVGDVVTYQAGLQLLQNGRAGAKGFDNKMGAYIVAEALRLVAQEGLPEDISVVAVGTTQEEVGYRGAMTAAYQLRPKIGIAVDVAHATDTSDTSQEQYGKLEIGKGPILNTGPYLHPVVFNLLVEAAESEGIPLQIEVAPDDTGTDASVMQVTRGGIATGLVGVALRYMHTPCELLSLQDVENCARLVAAFCRRLTPTIKLNPA